MSSVGIVLIPSCINSSMFSSNPSSAFRNALRFFSVRLFSYLVLSFLIQSSFNSFAGQIIIALSSLVLKKSLQSIDYKKAISYFNAVLNGYSNSKVIDNITDIERRGRYTH